MPRKGDRSSLRPIGNPEDPQGMFVLRERFLEWMSIQNFSERTVDIRRICIGYFIEWGEERGVVRPTEVARPILERYQRYLYYYRKKNSEPLSVRTQISRLGSVKSWFKWLARHHHVLYNPASEMEMPKIPFRLPKHVLTIQEAEKVLAQPNVSELLGLRDRAILETFYSTGMRRMELQGLRLYDLDEDRGTVMVRQGKGKKDRMIPIGERALHWVHRYLHEVRPALVIGDRSEDFLFLSNLGEAIHPVHLTKLVREYVLAADLGKKGSCHMFRHTMATLMLEGGADVRFIQAMLGHAKLDTTMVYAQVSIRKLKEIHHATHPAKLRQQSEEQEEALC